MFELFKNLYISHGDFGLPFRVMDYVFKHFYVWSFQGGASNLDGIIRLPGRLLSIFVFYLGGNLIASYFYLLLSFAIIALSFWVFLRHFLEIKNKWILSVATLLVTLSPVYLGYTAKIGLVAAVGLLPLCLLLVRKFFDSPRFVYLFLLILCLNYSLLHPYTFAINFLITFLYFAYKFVICRKEGLRYLKMLGIGVVAALLLNAYFILPIMSVGSVDKSALSASSEPVDYASIIDISNAGDPLSALTMTKHVFMDFEYYPDATNIVYTIGVLGLYALIGLLYMFVRRKMNRRETIMFAGATFTALLMTLLSSGHELVSDAFKILVNLPAGWIFRSPLKWQLYIPFFLITALAILLMKLPRKDLRIYLPVLGILFVMQSGYLLGEIYQKLLTPRSIDYLSSLQKLPDDRRLLFMTGDTCAEFNKENPKPVNEFSQIMNSKQIQLKQIRQEDMSDYKLTDYDYIVTCGENGNGIDTLSNKVEKSEDFKRTAFKLYKVNDTQQAKLLPELYVNADAQDANVKDNFLRKNFGKEFNYMHTAVPGVPAKSLLQIYGNLSASNIKDGAINLDKTLKPNSTYNLFATDNNGYYKSENGETTLSKSGGKEFKQFRPDVTPKIKTDKNGRYSFNYVDKDFKLKNTVKNGSFEGGSWKVKVRDCFAYDKEPKISMDIKKGDTPYGKSYLSLAAARHIACTSQETIPVTANASLLVSFAYKTNMDNRSGFRIVFNDKNRSSIGDRPDLSASDWTNYSKLFRVPKDATSATLVFYTYPTVDENFYVRNDFDNVSMVSMPSLVSDFFLTSDTENKYSGGTVSETNLNPSNKRYKLSNISGTALLRTNDTYNKKWQADVNGHSAGQYMKQVSANNASQTWAFDAKGYCASSSAECERDKDGTYNVELSASYMPQSKLELGMLISGAAFIACLIYLIIAHRPGRNATHPGSHAGRGSKKNGMKLGTPRKL